jgi:DNA polymerase-3 subunit delta'
MARLLTRGHEVAGVAVRAMLAGTTPHAILIAGPSGVGKTTLALDLAAGLLCEREDPAARPCRECRACLLVERGAHADLHRLEPGGAGNQIVIGKREAPEPWSIRRLLAELVLLPVEGRARVAVVERADRMNEDAQSALLKTLEEPAAGITIILCAAREDQLLPTIRSRCVRLRLGPVPVRDVEAILADQGVADAPTAARLARLSSGRPGVARTWALAPDAVTARSEIARVLLDLAEAPPARRLSVGRELLARSADMVRALDRAARPDALAAEGVSRPARRGRGTRVASGAGRGAAISPPSSPETDGGAGPAGPEEDAPDDGGGRDTQSSAAERRRAAAAFVEIWRDLARDLALVAYGETRRLRDPALLEDLRAASNIGPTLLGRFLVRLDDTAEMLEANVSPELAVDVLLLGWPSRPRAA